MSQAQPEAVPSKMSAQAAAARSSSGDNAAGAASVTSTPAAAAGHKSALRGRFRRLHLHEGAIDADSTSLLAAGVNLASFTRPRTSSVVARGKHGHRLGGLKGSISHDNLASLSQSSLLPPPRGRAGSDGPLDVPSLSTDMPKSAAAGSSSTASTAAPMRLADSAPYQTIQRGVSAMQQSSTISPVASPSSGSPARPQTQSPATGPMKSSTPPVSTGAQRRLVGGSGRDLRLGLLMRMQNIAGAPSPAPPSSLASGGGTLSAGEGNRARSDSSMTTRTVTVRERRAAWRRKKERRQEHISRLKGWRAQFEDTLSRRSGSMAEGPSTPLSMPSPLLGAESMPSAENPVAGGGVGGAAPPLLPPDASSLALLHALARHRRTRVAADSKSLTPSMAAAWDDLPSALKAAAGAWETTARAAVADAEAAVSKAMQQAQQRNSEHGTKSGGDFAEGPPVPLAVALAAAAAAPQRPLETDCVASEPITRSCPTWSASSAAARCASCGVPFSILVRKHHCRCCGLVMCHECTPFREVEAPPMIPLWWKLLVRQPEGPSRRGRAGSISGAYRSTSRERRLPKGVAALVEGGSAPPDKHPLDSVHLSLAGDEAPIDGVSALVNTPLTWSRLCVYCHGLLRGAVLPHPQVELALNDNYQRLTAGVALVADTHRAKAAQRVLRAAAHDGTGGTQLASGAALPAYVMAASRGEFYPPQPEDAGAPPAAARGGVTKPSAQPSFETVFWLQAVQLSIDSEVSHWLAMGVPVSATDRATGHTALHIAAAADNGPMVTRLVAEHSADVSALDVQNRTPLHLASIMGAARAVRALLAAKAPQDCPDTSGLTPFDYATAAGSHQLLAILDASQATGALGRWEHTKKEAAEATQSRLESARKARWGRESTFKHKQPAAAHKPAGADQPPSNAKGEPALRPPVPGGADGTSDPGTADPPQLGGTPLAAVPRSATPARSRSNSAGGGATHNISPKDALRTARRARPLQLPPRAALLQAGIARLDPAAQALQANLMALRNASIQHAYNEQWKRDVGVLSSRSRWQELGFLQPSAVHAAPAAWSHSAQETLFTVHTARVWRMGHCLGPDVDYFPLIAAAAGQESTVSGGVPDDVEGPSGASQADRRFGMDVDVLAHDSGDEQLEGSTDRAESGAGGLPGVAEEDEGGLSDEGSDDDGSDSDSDDPVNAHGGGGSITVSDSDESPRLQPRMGALAERKGGKGGGKAGASSHRPRADGGRPSV